MSASIFLPLCPLLSFVGILLFSHRMSIKNISLLAISGIGSSCLISFILFYESFFNHDKKQFFWHILPKIALLPQIEFAFYVDSLAIVMSMMISFVSFWIVVYSTNYMKNEEGYARFFSLINLFVSFMLLLILADNLFLLFIGWEGVGICSYLLIGFYYQKNKALSAATKAFLTTRIGDLFLLLAMILSYYFCKSINIQEINSFSLSNTYISFFIAFCLIMAATGKSAQIPLQIWLPDAMWGPTPVSALIHASTMVTAGVYLLARMSPIIFATRTGEFLVIAIGCFTLILGATSALVQDDLKKILAYSTMSQIGYMFLALGVNAPSAAIYHVITHAFFKSLLFLVAGVIGHALHSYEIKHMGGLYKKMPIISILFFIGSLSLIGFPLTSGFFSKEIIFHQAFIYPDMGISIFIIAIIGSLLTSLYTGRMIFLIFFNKSKNDFIFKNNKTINISLYMLALFSLLIGYIQTPLNINYLFSYLSSTINNYANKNEAEIYIIIIPIIISLIGIISAYTLWFNNSYLSERKNWAIVNLMKEGGKFNYLYEKIIINPYLFLSELIKNDPIIKIPTNINKRLTPLSNRCYDLHLSTINQQISLVVFCALALSSWMVWP